jgi:hypothetical protein
MYCRTPSHAGSRRSTLADAGQGEAVLDLRHRWQMVMKNDVSREIIS